MEFLNITFLVEMRNSCDALPAGIVHVCLPFLYVGVHGRSLSTSDDFRTLLSPL